MAQTLLQLAFTDAHTGLSKGTGEKHLSMSDSYAVPQLVDNAEDRTSESATRDISLSGAAQYGAGLQTDPHYYPAVAEGKILNKLVRPLIPSIPEHGRMRVVDFGSGTGKTTADYLRQLKMAAIVALPSTRFNLHFIGIDRAEALLADAEKVVEKVINPKIKHGKKSKEHSHNDTIDMIARDFRECTTFWNDRSKSRIKKQTSRRTIVLMLGFTICNSEITEIRQLLKDIYSCMQAGDELHVDTDSTSSEVTLGRAYGSIVLKKYFFNQLRWYVTNVLQLNGFDSKLKNYLYETKRDRDTHVCTTHLVSARRQEWRSLSGMLYTTIEKGESIRGYYGYKPPATEWKKLFTEGGFEVIGTTFHKEPNRKIRCDLWRLRKPAQKPLSAAMP